MDCVPLLSGAVCCLYSSAISSSLDLSLRTLDGDHIRPMAQALVDLPPEVARVANQAAATGGTLLGKFWCLTTCCLSAGGGVRCQHQRRHVFCSRHAHESVVQGVLSQYIS